MAERWPRDGREMAERWPRDRREIGERSPRDGRENRREMAERIAEGSPRCSRQGAAPHLEARGMLLAQHGVRGAVGVLFTARGVKRRASQQHGERGAAGEGHLLSHKAEDCAHRPLVGEELKLLFTAAGVKEGAAHRRPPPPVRRAREALSLPSLYMRSVGYARIMCLTQNS